LCWDAGKYHVWSKLLSLLWFLTIVIKFANFCYFPDADRARKHGMEEFISADPCKFDHASLFKMLQTQTLDYRLNDPYCSLVWYYDETSYRLLGSFALICFF